MLLPFAPGAPPEGYFDELAGLSNLAGEECTASMVHHGTHWL
jgi:hypothetical protein